MSPLLPQAGDRQHRAVPEASGCLESAFVSASAGISRPSVVSSARRRAPFTDWNETKKNDARYVEAYRACMKGRGFSS
jgi:hypothetical protein